MIAARRRAEEPEFVESYRRWRPMVERSIAWLVADAIGGCAIGASAATSSASHCGWRR
jgi:hypothetical protein